MKKIAIILEQIRQNDTEYNLIKKTIIRNENYKESMSCTWHQLKNKLGIGCD
jgi:hypothetical protein